jgi:FAD/FMN-containing dehydrogenase
MTTYMKAIDLRTNSGAVVHLSWDDTTQLRNTIHGRVLTAGDDGYDSARTLWNGLIDKKPGLVVRCADAADAVTAIRFAEQHRLQVLVKGGGHNVAGASLADDGFVIDLSTMRGVAVNPENRTVVAQGGARLGDLDRVTEPFGLAAPLGVVSATGVAGLTLHGGMGWLLRKHGLSIDNLLSVEIATAGGRLIKAGPFEHEDLFWAVRGGGGNFGVITAFEFKLHPVGPRVWVSMPIYPLESATEILPAFRAYMQKASDDLMALGVFWSAPEVPEVPPQYHGQPVLILLCCYTGPFEQGEQVIAPLRSFAEPIADLSGPMPWTQVQQLLDPDYPDGALYYWKSIYLDRLDDQVIQSLVKHAAARPSPLSSIDLWTLGRAMERIKATDTAFYKRDAPYMIGIEANWQEHRDSDANIAWAREVFTDLQQYTRGGHYLNFPGFFEDREKLLQGAYGPNLERLRAIKAKYDPENMFPGALNISPAAGDEKKEEHRQSATGM